MDSFQRILDNDFTAHFKVYHRNGVYEVQRVHKFKYSDILSVTEKEICFPSLSSLFRALLYDWPIIGMTDQTAFKDYVEKIFFNDFFPPFDSYELLKSFLCSIDPTLSFSFRQETDNIQEILKNHTGEYLAGTRMIAYSPLPAPNTYEELLNIFSVCNISLSRHKYWHFSSEIEFFFWTLEQIINSNTTIRTCPSCGRYFIPNHLSAKYCSSNCSYSSQSKTRFCGDMEVEKAYHRVYQAIKRKTRSMKKYRYNRPYYSKHYQDSVLFKNCSIPQNTPLNRYIFTKTDFIQIHQAYIEENEKHYTTFRNASIDFNDNLISSDEFTAIKDSYLEWLDNVRQQISAFEYF